ncbi:YdiU family protein [Malikia sp.]|uniref:protein adenylyltransferase SelO n=1 Tax=Malikia sp. TaxID=2070706 RepID=UPI00260CCFA4|nr:YdiU family protein [Malikia sp.]MDD2728015.1 YdiU family protein [Malikia sp.]
MQLQVSRFESLGDEFHTRLHPTPLPTPHWVGWSGEAAATLGLPTEPPPDDELLQRLSGNRIADSVTPIASVYSGHQFGHWAGQLGDGRALLLGEHAASGLEVQLKGAGRTPYSRGGDGRAVLRSSIREFLCSEAMHALGIPTTRALCVTGSPAPVRREEVETAAVVTRLAPSFIRFGHFEHFSHNGRHAELRRLADFVIDNFYPEYRQADGNPYAGLLAAVTRRSAELVAQWQAVGFCHGVLNTDNMSILGLTLDYGPFQFLDGFDPGHVCNHSDSSGRYAYARQPNIVYWNLFCLGQALLPLLDDSQQALDALEPYKALFPAALQRRMNAKLGLDDPRTGDAELTEDLLQLLARERTDYTIFWRRLSLAQAASEADAGQAGQGAAVRPLTPHWQPVRDLFLQPEAFDDWWARWRQRLQLPADAGASAGSDSQAGQRMLRANPRVVLRNHLGEVAIRQAQAGDPSALQRLQAALASPYDERSDSADLADFPPDWAAAISISCSS